MQKNAEQDALPFDLVQKRGVLRIEDAAHQAQRPKAWAKFSHFVPHRHRQGDFFIADILDAIPKGDLASMEHPLFALKAGDMRVRAYERMGEMFERLNGTRIETNIETDGIRERGWFGLIDYAKFCSGWILNRFKRPIARFFEL